ncbi:formyl peptide receptor-related sequence 6-like [Esox lucius]|uniref:formyl peptide receptor-related sequence 6-like n=1 Tax=Esox lucius TaxID=8010 RepID=UPI001476DD6C|nr:formyl peptide receptor-related sequence 6-like [Esox lucius]
MENDVNYTHDSVNTIEVGVASITHNRCFTDGFCILYLVVNIVTFLVGVLGNGLVIWITVLKMKKTVNTTWYLSLAVSDFIFYVAFLPFNIVRIVTEECIFGPFICHFTFPLIYISLFSSVFLLVIISVDHCVLVVFPVWAQTIRTVNKASVVVVLAWVLSIALSTRYIFAGETHNYKMKVVGLFIGGFAMPFLIIMFCYSVIILQLRTRRMMNVSSKSLRVMTVLIVMFFISWLPFHVFILLEKNHQNYNLEILRTGLIVGITFSTVNSFLRPVLYVCMGNNIPTTLKRSIVGRIENVLGEEDPPTTSHETSSHL